MTYPNDPYGSPFDGNGRDSRSDQGAGNNPFGTHGASGGQQPYGSGADDAEQGFPYPGAQNPQPQQRSGDFGGGSSGSYGSYGAQEPGLDHQSAYGGGQPGYAGHQANYAGPQQPYGTYDPHGIAGVGPGEQFGDVVAPMRDFDIMNAFKWGIKRTLNNWMLWILVPLLLGIGFFAVFFGVMVTSPAMQARSTESYQSFDEVMAELGTLLIVYGLFFVAMLFLGPIAYNAMVKQLNQAKMGVGDAVSGVRWLSIIGTMIGVALIAVFVELLVVIPAAFAIGFGAAEENAALTVLGIVLFIVVYVAVFFVSTRLSLAIYFAAEGGAENPISASWKATKGHFWHLFGYMLLVGLLLFVGTMVTFGFGAVVLYPAYYLGLAYMYRQIRGDYEGRSMGAPAPQVVGY